MTLNPSAAVEPPVLDDAPTGMIPVLPPFGLSREHGGEDFAADARVRESTPAMPSDICIRAKRILGGRVVVGLGVQARLLDDDRAEILRRRVHVADGDRLALEIRDLVDPEILTGTGRDDGFDRRAARSRAALPAWRRTRWRDRPSRILRNQSAREPPLERVNAALSLGATGWQLFRHIIPLSALPEILTALRIALGVGRGTLVAAELIASTRAIGYMIMSVSNFLATDVVFVGIAVIAASAFLFSHAPRCLESVLVPWRGKS